MALHQIPESKENNVWYSYSGSDTVLVFLHGIFSDSSGCCLHEDPAANRPRVFWPELIANDPNFRGRGIFLGGFYAELEAADYDLIQCSLEVYQSLTLPQSPAAESVAPKTLIFLGHSTGGIVARYMLERSTQ